MMRLFAGHLFGGQRFRRRMMSASAFDMEKCLYRFILGGVVGFVLGAHFLPNTNQGVTYNISFNAECATPNIDQSSIMTVRKITTAKRDHKTRKGNIYIGMMSMENKLDTRVASAIRTWMQHSGVKIGVFANNNGTKDDRYHHISSYLDNGLPVIQLPGVNDKVYPPQKKSFSMIKFMFDMHVNDFDWFVRLDDDAYVNVEKLQIFLSKLNASKPVYMGNAGFGRDSDDYLKLGENYCMGGPGMVFSRALLLKLGPKLGECLQSLMTEHEDIELGRCVQRMTGVKCTLSWQTKKLFFQNFKDGTYAPNIKSITTKEIDNGIIFHANKEQRYQYKLHVAMLKHKIATLIQRVTKFEKEIRKDFESEADQHNLGVNSYSQYHWDAIVRSNMFKAKEDKLNKKMQARLKDVLLDNTNEFVSIYDYKKQVAHAKLKSVSLELSYRVVNPIFSVDTISQMLCTFIPKSSAHSALLRYEDRTRNVIVHQRQYLTASTQFLHEPNELVPDDIKKFIKIQKISHQTSFQTELNHPYFPSTPEVAVNFITALSGRPENFVRFLNNFENTFLKRGEKVNLIITFFPESAMLSDKATEGNGDVVVDADTIRQQEMVEESPKPATIVGDGVVLITEHLRSLQEKYPLSKLKVVSMKPGTEFSRGIGLQTASDHVFSDDEILFFCDVDLIFELGILNHIRRNSVQGRQVYFPVFFSQYDPDVVYVERPKPPTHFHFEELDGFWRYFSFGMLSIYKSDFKKTEGFDLNIHGWGLEDLHMVKAIQDSGLDVIQSAEPAQVHVFHDKFCNPTTSNKQYQDCLKSRASHYGPKTLLYYVWKAPDTYIVDSEEEQVVALK